MILCLLKRKPFLFWCIILFTSLKLSTARIYMNNNNNNTRLTTVVLILVIFTRLDEYNITYRIISEDLQGKKKSVFQTKN